MYDFFEILGVERKFALDAELVSDRFRELAAENHPDREEGESDEFRVLNEARRVLGSPSKRVAHLIALELGEENASLRGTLSPGLMDLFSPVAAVIQEADAVLAKREAAQSALARALTEGDATKCREELAACQSKVGEEIEAETNKLAGFDELGAKACAEEALECARNLSFLEKWSAQLKERFGRLF